MRQIFVGSKITTTYLQGGPFVGDKIVNDNGDAGTFVTTVDGRMRIQYDDEPHVEALVRRNAK